MHPANCRSVAGRLHFPLADVRMHKIRAEDKEGNVDGKYTHVDWRASQDDAFSAGCATIVVADDHAKVKPDISTSTSKHRVYQICSNHKTAPDHDTHSKTQNSNIIIDSIVRLTEDTVMNRERLEGTQKPLQQHGGKEVLVSRNGGFPCAVVQAERYNPSAAAQKVNNLEQLWTANLEAWDRCALFFYSDKGADHNPEFFEVILATLLLFFLKKLCYSSHRVHCGGHNAYNTGPERLIAIETKELCNVPISSQPYGQPFNAETGELDERMVRKNSDWDMAEVISRVGEGRFCDNKVEAIEALPCKCKGTCGEGCECELGFITDEKREALRAYYKGGVQKRAEWGDRAQAREFDRLIGFMCSPEHTLLGKYGFEFLACWEDDCEFGCMERFEAGSRALDSSAACCDHEECRRRTVLGTAIFAPEPGHFLDSKARAELVESPPWDPENVAKCLPSKLLRAELLKRDFLWRDEDVTSFVDGALNGCCNEKDALEQVQKWKLQKLGADARARGRHRQRLEAVGGAEAERPGDRGGRGQGAAPRIGGSRGGNRDELVEYVYSAFAAPSDWAGRDAAVGDDSDFWLAVEKGFQRGSRKQVIV